MPYAQHLMQYFTMEQNLDFLLRILIACFCGAAIGYERSRRFKEAGIRTHVIVCCASPVTFLFTSPASDRAADGAVPPTGFTSSVTTAGPSVSVYVTVTVRETGSCTTESTVTDGPAKSAPARPAQTKHNIRFICHPPLLT